MICGDCSLSSMIITESQDMQGVFSPIEVIWISYWLQHFTKEHVLFEDLVTCTFFGLQPLKFCGCQYLQCLADGWELYQPFIFWRTRMQLN
jgi:hypothetical protein